MTAGSNAAVQHSPNLLDRRGSSPQRIKLRKSSSAYSQDLTPTPSDKSLTSFPSLSPTSSPISARHESPHVRKRQNSPKSRQPPVSAPSHLRDISAPQAFRPPLFDDSPLSHVPGSLHHASDDHLERLIARHGAVSLVRQLAEDLAQRDAQISAVRRRAEERERLLKKMLLECEISNLDIETRLRSTGTGETRTISGVSKTKLQEGGKAARRTSVGAETARSADGSIDEMLDQAMAEDVGVDEDGSSPFGFGEDMHATIRAVGVLTPPDDESRSLESGAEAKSKAAGRGWKEYLWGGTSKKSSRASSVVSELNEEVESAVEKRVASGPTIKRKALQSDLFRPVDDLNDGSSIAGRRPAPRPQELRDNDVENSQSRRSSGVVASWALKLVAGNTQGSRESEPSGNARGRAVTTNGTTRGSRTTSVASTSTAASAKGGQTKNALRRATGATGMGPTGTIKGTTQGSWLNAASNIMPAASSTPSAADKDDNNLGPVEMDTILPPELQPPTLTQVYSAHNPTEYLTDRFGFIYDQRRRKRAKAMAEDAKSGHKGQNKMEMLSTGRAGQNGGDGEDYENEGPLEIALSDDQERPETPASMESQSNQQKSRKSWQEYLRDATSRTELLSHTPFGVSEPIGGISSDNMPKSTPQFTIGDGVSLPAPNVTSVSASTVVSEPASLAQPSLSGPTTPVTSKPVEQWEPVKLLLEQLTELHDSLQRDRVLKWNEFLRKVRAERRRDDEILQADGKKTILPEVSIADGEIIGVATLGNRGKVGRAKWKEFKLLVLAGIPVTYRAKIWAECSGASALRVPGYYDDLVNHGTDDPLVVAQISMDIHRTLTDNVFFRNGPGVTKLQEVLLAYSRRNPEIGYCQGMNMIAASLLLIMPSAEDAFWLLTSMIENLLPQNYYDHSLLASRADQQVLRQYVAEILPKLSNHLDELGIELEALTFQWFLSVFTDCLSAEALFRVWDVILCVDGSTFLFQVALALLKLNEKQLLACMSAAGVYTYINHNMTNHAISIDGLVQASDALKKVVRKGEVEKRRAAAVQEELVQLKLRRELGSMVGLRRKSTREKINEVVGNRVPQAESTEHALQTEHGDFDLQMQSPIPIVDIPTVENEARTRMTLEDFQWDRLIAPSGHAV